MQGQKSLGHLQVDDVECQNLRSSINDEDAVDELHAVRQRLEDVVAPAQSDEVLTAVTGATSEFSYSDSDVSIPSMTGFCWSRYSSSLAAAATGLISLISPVMMVVIPKAGLAELNVVDCDADCQLILVGLSIRLLLLIIATCMLLFLYRPSSSMPRVFIYRVLLISLLVVTTITFWLFYVFRVLGKHSEQVAGLPDEEQNMLLYEDVVRFVASYVEVLVFVHYLAVVIIQLRQRGLLFAVKVTRSPDGASQSYSVGRLSIQRLAIWCLQQYYRDFKVSCSLEFYQQYLECNILLYSLYKKKQCCNCLY